MDCKLDAPGWRKRSPAGPVSNADRPSRYRLCIEAPSQPALLMQAPPRPDLPRARAADADLGTAARAGVEVDVQLGNGSWDRAEIVAEGLDDRRGWQILLRWCGGYQDWFVPDPARIRRVTEVPGHALEPARDAIAVCERALSAALSLSGADMGNVQLVGPATGALRIVAQHGFGRPFLDFFSVVEGEESACGQAFQAAQPVWVSDVSTSPVFAGSGAQGAVLGAGVRAVASVPVIGPAEEVRAVISVHGRQVAGWTAGQQRQMEDLALATGRRLADRES